MILLGALYHDVNAILPVSALIYALAPPAIHVAHGQAGVAAASVRKITLRTRRGRALE
jgi:hypothetical protein